MASLHKARDQGDFDMETWEEAIRNAVPLQSEPARGVAGKSGMRTTRRSRARCGGAPHAQYWRPAEDPHHTAW